MAGMLMFFSSAMAAYKLAGAERSILSGYLWTMYGELPRISFATASLGE
jgi:hypothetical protein